MKTLQLKCNRCVSYVSVSLLEASVHTACPTCQTEVHIEAFPAMLRQSEAGKTGEALYAEDESSCFYHPDKRAVVHCESCGRFLCSLCDVDFGGKHMCSPCIEKGAEKGKIGQLQNSRTRYDRIALMLAVVPLLFFCVTVITAPAAIFMAVRYWKTPLSVVPHSRWRYVVAMLLAGLQLVGWGFAGIGLLNQMLS